MNEFVVVSKVFEVPVVDGKPRKDLLYKFNQLFNDSQDEVINRSEQRL